MIQINVKSTYEKNKEYDIKKVSIKKFIMGTFNKNLAAELI